MPGKAKITSKDYVRLRKPGEVREAPATEDGGKSSRAKESEKGNKAVAVADEVPVQNKSNRGEDDEKPSAEVRQDKENQEEKNQTLPSHVENVTSEESEVTKEASPKEQSGESTNTKAVAGEDSLSNSILKNEPSATEPTDKGTKLNPYAAEFVPGGAFTLAPSAYTPEFLPESFAQKERPPLLRKQLNSQENELVNFMKSILLRLTKRPGELERYVDLLASMFKFKKWLSELTSLKETVDIIFEYSITEPNFQNIAARLCNLLTMREDLWPLKGATFRSIFMNRCRDEHLNREASLKDPQKTNRVLCFAMFLGELFCNYRPLGKTQPLTVFHRAVLEMLTTLLNYGTEDALSCVGNILKMTGFLLDDARFKSDKDKVSKINKVFSDVEQLTKESKVSNSVKKLLSQVAKLRATNWGVAGASPSGPYDYPEAPGGVYLPEVTYVDGQHLLQSGVMSSRRGRRRQGQQRWYDGACAMNDQLEVVPVPTQLIGLIIGTKGRSKQEISSKTGVQIHVKDNEVYLRGTAEQRKKAKEIIEEIVARTQRTGSSPKSGMKKLDFIPDQFLGHVIGNGELIYAPLRWRRALP